MKHKLRHNVKSESEFYFSNWWLACFALIIMTFAVDWALCIRNHSISQFKCPKQRAYPNSPIEKNKQTKKHEKKTKNFDGLTLHKWFNLRTIPPESNTLFWKENGQECYKSVRCVHFPRVCSTSWWWKLTHKRYWNKQWITLFNCQNYECFKMFNELSSADWSAWKFRWQRSVRQLKPMLSDNHITSV